MPPWPTGGAQAPRESLRSNGEAAQTPPYMQQRALIRMHKAQLQARRAFQSRTCSHSSGQPCVHRRRRHARTARRGKSCSLHTRQQVGSITPVWHGAVMSAARCSACAGHTGSHIKPAGDGAQRASPPPPKCGALAASALIAARFLVSHSRESHYVVQADGSPLRPAPGVSSLPGTGPGAVRPRLGQRVPA